MKMKRNLIIIGAALALVIALVLVAPNLKPAEPTPTPASTQSQDTSMLKLSDYKVEQVSEVIVANDKQTYTIYKQGENFAIKGQESLTLDQTRVGSLVSYAASVTGVKAIEQNPKDLSVYGLDKPPAKITVKYTDGKTNVFLLGNATAARDTNYFMMEGDDWVVTVPAYVGSGYLKTIESLVLKGTITITQEEVETVKMLKNGAVELELTTLAPESKISISTWTIVQPWKRAGDNEVIDAYLKSILGVQMGDVVDANATDLAKYGLDKPEYDITISGKGKSNELLIGSDKDENYTYVKFADSNLVYLVSKASLEFKKTSAYKLMDKTIILVNIISALGVDFKGLGVQSKLVIVHKPALDDKGEQKLDGNGKPMYDQTFSINGKDVEDKVARFYYQTCIGLTTHSMVKEGWQPSGEPVAVLTYMRNTEPTVIAIEFMAYDKDFYAVRMNGGTYFLIKQEKVKKVAEDLTKLIAGELTVPK